MRANRSIPDSSVIPVLLYDDVAAAVDWLCAAFGFTERLRIGDHRAQLTVGGGALVVAGREPARGSEDGGDARPRGSVMVRVEDADAHFRRATGHGARVVRPPEDHAYGERQYTVADPGGHVWTFTQTIADVHPAEWGGVLRDDPGAAGGAPESDPGT